MENPRRLAGIDLIRGISAYGVAILHSGDAGSGISVDFSATQLHRFFGFVVPFFILASFYFLIKRMYTTGKSYSLKSRFQRLIIPYLVWSLLYTLMRLVKLFLVGEPANLEKVTDIPSLIFLGGAGIHLYFVPLLFVGTFSLFFAERLIKKKVQLSELLFWLFLSSLIAEAVYATGNSFDLINYSAFENMSSIILPTGNENSFIRVLLVYIAWTIRCLPYIFAAMIINKFLLENNSLLRDQNCLMFSFLAFWGITILGVLNVDDLSQPTYLDRKLPIYELFQAISLLLFSIYLSPYISSSAIVKSVGVCSFGIYLMHQALIQLVRIPMVKILPDFVLFVSIPTQVFFASLSTIISWLLTSLLMRHKLLAKFMFGA